MRSTTRVAVLTVVLLLCGLLLPLAGCDSGGGGDPVPEFEARITGAEQRTFRGTAGVRDSDTFARTLPPSLVLPLTPIVPDSLFSGRRPDTLFTIPDSLSQPPPSSTLILGATDDDGEARRGDGLTFVIEGNDRPAPDTYDLSGLAGFVGGIDDGGTIPAEIPPAIAVYTRLDASTFRVVPAIGGTLTIEESTPDVVRGTFDLQTALAFETPVPVPLDTTLASRVTQRFYAAQIEGAFTATPTADAAVPLPLSTLDRRPDGLGQLGTGH